MKSRRGNSISPTTRRMQAWSLSMPLSFRHRSSSHSPCRSRFARSSKLSARLAASSLCDNACRALRRSSEEISQVGPGQFRRQERREFEVRHPSRQRFTRLPQQVARRRTEQQEATCPPVGIDFGTKRGEDFGGELDFVENQQTVPVRGEEQFRVAQRGAVRLALEIEDQGIGMPAGNGTRQRRFSALPWAEQDDGRRLAKSAGDQFLETASILAF